MILFVYLASCSSPLIIRGNGVSLSLSFTFSSQTLQSKSSGEVQSRLLLPSAKKLVVSLVPSSAGLSQQTSQTITLDGQSNPLTFSNIIVGTYTISAEAFDASNTLVFHQSLTVGLSGSSANITLNLVPVVPEGYSFPELADSSPLSGLLLPQESKTFVIPKTALSQGTFNVLLDAVSTVDFYVQDSRGTQLNSNTQNRALGHSFEDLADLDTVFVTLHNTSEFTQNYSLYFAPIASIACILEFQTLTFSTTQHTLNSSSANPLVRDLTITNSNPTLSALSGWKWYVNNVLDTSQTTSSFAWSSLGKADGNYLVSTSITHQGIEYSASLRITVISTTETQYSVTYSNSGADEGSVPIDNNLYTSGTITLLGNTGGLKKAYSTFLGWTDNSTGTGRIYKAGDTYTINNANLNFYPAWLTAVHIPGGTFQRDSTATNRSTVSSFALGKYEVTQAQYEAVMGTNPSHELNYSDSSVRPVTKVTWYKAMEFCNRLSLLDGLVPVYTISYNTDPNNWPALTDGSRNDAWDAVAYNRNANGYRLPTEMEWRWAAMGGLSDSNTGDIVAGINTGGYQKVYAGFDGGITHVNDYAWSTNNTQVGADFFSHPVGTRLANELKLFDMSGNVYEWTQDATVTRNDAYPAGTLVDYDREDVSANRILCSGSFGDSAFVFLPGFRMQWEYPPYLVDRSIGLRVARSIPDRTYIPRSGLVGEWLMDTTFTVTDTSGQGKNAVRGGGGETTVNNRKDMANSAISVSSVQYTVTNSALNFASTQSFSLSIWFKITAFPSVEVSLISMPSVPNNFQYYLKLNNTGKLVAGVGVNSQAQDPLLKQIAVDQWNHAVLSYNGSSVYLYLNGEYIDQTDPYTGGFKVSSGDLQISTSGPPYYVGQLDDVRVYNRPLFDDEVLHLYQE